MSDDVYERKRVKIGGPSTGLHAMLWQESAMARKIDEGRLNQWLLVPKRGKDVFRRLRDFGQAVWGRRIGVKDGDVDFLLLNTTSPRLAVVECTRTLSGDLGQLRKYYRRIASRSARGVLQAIEAAILAENKPGVRDRAKANCGSSLGEWLRSTPEDQRLQAIATAMREPLVAVLLVYLTVGSRGEFEVLKEVHLPSRLLGVRDADFRVVLVASR